MPTECTDTDLFSNDKDRNRSSGIWALSREPKSIEQLSVISRELAESLSVSARPPRTKSLLSTVRELKGYLLGVYEDLASDVRGGVPISSGAEWILDNFFVIEDQLREIADDLPPGYERQLPKLANGTPRVRAIGRELVAHTDGAIDEESLHRFIGEFQIVAPLSIGELWAVPIMLRLALIENLCATCSQIMHTRKCEAWAVQLHEHWQVHRSLNVDPLPMERVCALTPELIEKFQEPGATHAAGLVELSHRMEKHGLTISEVVHREHQRRASNQITVANIITSMRLISSLDWIVFFERNSLVEAALRADPAEIYSHLDIESRDRYRHVVEEIAKRSAFSDIDVAKAACELAHSRDVGGDGEMVRTHVGYWLQLPGQADLESRVGYALPLREKILRVACSHPNWTYFGSLVVLTALGLCLVMALASSSGANVASTIFLTLCAVIPVSELAVLITNLMVTTCIPPRLLPKLDFSKGVPDHFKTVVAVPCLLTSPREVDQLLSNLEIHFLSNPESAIRFALLTDFVDHAGASRTDDDELLNRAIRGVRQLNLRYASDGSPFLLFHRSRQWNSVDECWMGWERKRGKLMEFNQWLLGSQKTSFVVFEGETDWFWLDRQQPAVRFVITLDADTFLPNGTATKLIGALGHPLNSPRVEADTGRVVAGYGVLQPRVNIRLSDSNRSWYSRIFANSPGIDPYVTSASDVYQDLFGEGSFTGKGIYDVRTLARVLEGTFPDNQILSHDLIEGCHVRAALVSDIELTDGFPARYEADARRQHRWVRGDWQLLPWLLPKVPSRSGVRSNPLSMLSRWKIFDNLRRSLVPATLLALLLGSWFILPPNAWPWSLLGFAVLAFPLLSQFPRVFRFVPRKVDWRIHFKSVIGEITRGIVQSIFAMAILPHRAFLMIDAIARTLWRQMISRRKMLEWETAAATERRLNRRNSRPSLRLLWPCLVAGGVALVIPFLSWLAALPWLLAWLASPLFRNWINRPLPRHTADFTDDDRRFLRRMGRRTWAFFETFVGADDNWLPPDNAQEIPTPKIAHRISPTNQGLFMVSGLVAHDFGYIGVHSLIDLWEQNLASWEKLDRFNGHYLNWYDTVSLRPLFPRYISAVDSGNLDACCLLMRQGIEDLKTAHVLGERVWRGIVDSIEMAEDSLAAHLQNGVGDDSTDINRLRGALRALKDRFSSQPEDLLDWHHRLRQASMQYAAITDLISPTESSDNHEVNEATIKIRHLANHIESIRKDARLLFAWHDVLAEVVDRGKTPSQSSSLPWSTAETNLNDGWHDLWTSLIEHLSVSRIAKLDENAAPLLAVVRSAWEKLDGDFRVESLKWLERLQGSLSQASTAADQLEARMTSLAERYEAISAGMDYRFLYNPQRRLFSIGYNLEDKQLDRGHYDMLCSEARLASFLAVGKGHAETRHWFQLGRQLTSANGRASLLSWGGTMFEYLMPNLFQRRYEGSLLDASCRGAVARQREYGRQQRVPWGISESAFAALSLNAEYQYRSFGVPGLGLKRGLGKDLVVSPYSTFLALEIEPRASTENLRRLVEAEALGPWGFYDAVDYSPSRMPMGARSIVVRCVMSHHQSMSLLALANALANGSLRRRFHNHPLVRATELLLQERVPSNVQSVTPHPDDLVVTPTRPSEVEFVSRRFAGVSTGSPRTHLLSNGRLTTMLTSNGGGFCRHGELAITRWRPDSTRDHWGSFFYVREMRSGKVWSPAYQPTCVVPDAYEVLFSIDKAEYFRRDGDIETRMEVAVSPENNAEVRSLKITNDSSLDCEIEITSCAEVALASWAADLAHPAFEKLFLQTEFLVSPPAILVSRRPRDAAHTPPWAIHVMAIENDLTHDVQFETSRQKFIGRGRTLRSPCALSDGSRLSGSSGAVLDPVMALRCTLRLAPNETALVGFATAYAESRDEAELLARQYHDPRSIQRAFDLAWAYNQIQLRHMHLTPTQAHLYQRMASALLYPDAAHRGRPELLSLNKQSQIGLWRHGISGDRPLLLLHLTQPEQLYLVRDVMAAQQYWQAHGLATDVVLLNDHPGSYFDLLHEQLTTLINEFPRISDDKSTGVFVLRSSQIGEDDKALLETVASIVLHGSQGSLSRQFRTRPDTSGTGDGKFARATQGVRARTQSPSGYPNVIRNAGEIDIARRMQLITELEFWNGMGGFAQQGREYRILLSGRSTTPMPWSNVIANPNFGCLVTESGGGFTWSGNSRENRLTTWANDPISDTPAEALYIRDDDAWNTWSPFPGIFRNAGDYWIHHGQGYTQFNHIVAGFEHEVHISVAQNDPIKFVRVRLRNRVARQRRLSLIYFIEWVLGDTREKTGLHIVTAADGETGALLASNGYHQDYASQVAFLQVLEHARTMTGDRAEFLGRNGSPSAPEALQWEELSGRVGAGWDPCGALHVNITVDPMAEVEVIFLLGAGQDLDAVRGLLNKYSTPDAVNQEIERSLAEWERILGAVQVETPDKALNLLVNRWLLYQVISCRLWGRSAFYQSGGAFGFRDQLQDVMALLTCTPDFAREHLIRAAARQFEEGDVQHWWHPPSGRGTRTRFSDDLLWLPYVVAKYVDVTGDVGILDENISYLRSNPLEAHEQERYETPAISSRLGSLYEHCILAINHGLKLGQHGLPLMGCGDWNDGMNRVGDQGKGESIWVGWFLVVILKRFVPLMEARGDAATAAAYNQIHKQLSAALENHGWDGQWYRRAYTDEGQALGSVQNSECQIDSIAQSWAAFAEADPDRVSKALHEASKRLILPDKNLVLLLTPPFDNGGLDPGYIQGYLPGIRENGGQYTHAAIWLMQAFCLTKDVNQALAILKMIHPISHASSPAGIQTYQVEPYVMSADVYGVDPHVGRGGWTWYTGSAGWMYQAIIESLLGIRIERNQVSVAARLPDGWPQFKFTIQGQRTTWRFTVNNDSIATKSNGRATDDRPTIPLVEDGRIHEFVISVPRAQFENSSNPVKYEPKA